MYGESLDIRMETVTGEMSRVGQDWPMRGKITQGFPGGASTPYGSGGKVAEPFLLTSFRFEGSGGLHIDIWLVGSRYGKVQWHNTPENPEC